ncbi:MAG: PRC-barrel domain-containing protein [Candidatus Bathyarchaeota archaeon]|nr:PRC-barrel domain-containing protein [Candidatus Bathyarchaeota archaeon]
MVSVDEVSGRKVVSIKGDEIGEIKDVEFDIKKWEVTHMVLKLSNKAAVSLGYKKTIGSYDVCMPVSLISSVGDVVTINKTLLEIAENLDIKECPPRTMHRGMTIGL